MINQTKENVTVLVIVVIVTNIFSAPAMPLVQILVNSGMSMGIHENVVAVNKIGQRQNILNHQSVINRPNFSSVMRCFL